MEPMVTVALGVVDALATENTGLFGSAEVGYLGHVRRVTTMAARQLDLDEASARLLGVAAFFHDSGIWLDGTFDYLAPSIERAVEHMGPEAEADSELVEAVISDHHRLRRSDHPNPMVEAFRRSDLADLTFGLLRCPGTKLSEYRSLVGSHPSAGFRRGLVAQFGRWARRHPLRPLPMVKW